jgi:DNA primase
MSTPRTRTREPVQAGPRGTAGPDEPHREQEPEQSQISPLLTLARVAALGLQTGEQWQGWLRRAERFAGLGFTNTMLVWAQRPDASLLLEYPAWRRLGRQVTKGERGVRLIVPVREARQEGTPGIRHRIGIVFDLSQTKGKPVPVRLSPSGYDAPPPPGAENALESLSMREGFRVLRGDCAEGDACTDWRSRRIHVRADADELTAVAALAHQVGHVLLHADVPYLDGSGELECCGVRKVEADSVAYLIAVRLGLDTGEFRFPYVGSWAGTDERARPAETIEMVGDRILIAAAKAFTCIDANTPSLGRLVGDVQPARAEEAGRVPARAEAGQANPAIVRRSPVTSRPPQSPPVPAPDSEAVLMHQAAARFFAGHLSGSWAADYLERRGFAEPIQRQWGIGYAPAAWTALTDHLRDLGYRDTAIEASGLAKRSRGSLIDAFRDRVILPIHSPNGIVLGFIGRAAENADNHVPKYLNSKDTELYRKGSVLFGLHEGREALAQGARPVIVEGPLDAIAVTIAGPGRYAGAAPCGTALTAEQVAALSQAADLRETGVLVAFDSDQAGQKAAVRAYGLLRDVTDRPMMVVFPDGQDPAGLLRDAGVGGLVQVLDTEARPLADLVIDASIEKWDRWLQFTDGKFNALRATGPLIAQLPGTEVARQVARVAERLELAHAEVTEAVTAALTAGSAAARQLPDQGHLDLPPPAQPRRPRRHPVRHASRDFPQSASRPVQLNPADETSGNPPLTRASVSPACGNRSRRQ